MNGPLLNESEALSMFQGAPLIHLMRDAHEIRQSLHPNRDVTFVVDTNPNYTNICETECKFCSFYRRPTDVDSYVLSPEAIAEKALADVRRGATTMLLQGGHNPALRLPYYLDIIRTIRERVPGIHLHGFSPTEIAFIAKIEKMTTSDVLRAFWDEGLRSIPGGGAEILVDRVRQMVSPKKLRANEWLRVMKEAHAIGFKTTATMTFGHREQPIDIIDHLFKLQRLQEESGGFLAFIPWSFKPGSSPLSKVIPVGALPSYYIRVIATARMILRSIPHIQASWFGEGWRAGQIALNAGADDFGGVLLEENVLREAGHRYETRVENVASIIREAGFVPVQRTTLYEKLCKHESSSKDRSLSPMVMATREKV